MSVQVENLEKNLAKLTIEVDADKVEEAIEKVYRQQKNKITVQGFRKGKAPRHIIEKMYGKGVFLEDAANDMIPQAYEDAAKESGLDIVSQPKLDVVQLESGKSFIFTAEVAVKPEVTLGEYMGVEIEKTDVEVTEEEVMAEIEKERESNSRTITVDDRAVQDKDDVKIDFEGFVDGVAFDGGKAEDYALTIGSHTFIDNFEEQLIGVNIGEEKKVNVTFPENYQAEELAGKPAEFIVTVKEIKVKELPELDDDFAQDVSEFDTLEEYKADVKKNLSEEKEKEALAAKEDKAIEKVIENATMEIPDLMIETQTRNIAEDFARRIQQQGLSIEQYFQFTGLTSETFFEQLKPQALKRIQSRLVLEKIVELEKIEVSDEKVEEELKKMAETYQMEVEKVKELMGEEELKVMRSDLAVMEAATKVRDAAKEV